MSRLASSRRSSTTSLRSPNHGRRRARSGRRVGCRSRVSGSWDPMGPRLRSCLARSRKPCGRRSSAPARGPKESAAFEALRAWCRARTNDRPVRVHHPGAGARPRRARRTGSIWSRRTVDDPEYGADTAQRVARRPVDRGGAGRARRLVVRSPRRGRADAADRPLVRPGARLVGHPGRVAARRRRARAAADTRAARTGSRRTWRSCTPPRDSVVRMLLRIFTEPQQGASYDDLLAVAQQTEECGFDAFFRSDHYLVMGDERRPAGPDRRLDHAGRPGPRDEAGSSSARWSARPRSAIPACSRSPSRRSTR